MLLLNVETSLAPVTEQPFRYQWKGNWGAGEEPLHSWQHLEVITELLGVADDLAFIIVSRTDQYRAAQLLGRAAPGRYVLELLPGDGNVYGARPAGSELGDWTTILPRDGGVHSAPLSEVWADASLAVPTMRRWLESGSTEGVELREIHYAGSRKRRPQ